MAYFLLIFGGSCLQLLLHGFVSQVNGSPANCTERDFGLAVFPCDAKNRTRSYLFFMKRLCNPLAPGAYFPKPKHNIPCDCPPGQGLSLTEKGFIVCRTCQPGDYSVGGELIDDWRFWNASNGVPGSNYRIHVYCADIVVGSHCQSWKPGGNFKYLVSGPFKNSTGFLNCLQQKGMVMHRLFVNEGDNNIVSFRYKVDGGPCSKNAKMCANGLHFYIDNKRVLHADVQFKWTLFTARVSKGMHMLRWIYQSSCKRSETPSLDVAYIEHLALVGTVDPNTRCRQCPRGTFSNLNASSECTKCSPGTFQNRTGQTSCEQCPENTFSRIGDDRCISLPMCTKADLTMVPLPVDKCFKQDETFHRKQMRMLPKWPGMDLNACHSLEKIPSPPSTVKCGCQPGYFLKEDGDKVTCERCDLGKFSQGNTSRCESCPKGYAAIPGLYIREWPYGVLPHAITTNCSRSYCKNGWVSGGSFARTERIEGNFETYMEIKDVNINYFRSRITFQCSVDCRINPGQPALAKDSNCFLRFTVRKGNRTIHDRDCIRYGGNRYRNGTVMNHTYALSDTGKYTFRWLFHHGDPSVTSLYSYEGRVYQIDIDGVEGGSAKSCVGCPAGTFVSTKKSLCVKCSKGQYSVAGSTKCKPCPANTFAAKPGRSKCTKCGNHTVHNSTRDGCDFNKCKFYAGEGLLYDLSPLGNDGGAMTKVVTSRGVGSWFNVYYYVNPCFVNHDNSSCVWRGRVMDTNGKYKGFGTTILRTMACKRWAFDPSHSFSLGHVIGYIPNEKDPGGGLTLQLLDGYDCYDRHVRKTVKASTHIDLICDTSVGRGYPTQVNNQTAIEERPCFFHMVWRSIYACPICLNDDYETVHTDCVNGKMNVTTTLRRRCRIADSTSYLKHVTKPCQVLVNPTKKRTNTILIVVVVLFVLITLTSLVVILVLCRRNQSYRVQLFSSGKTLAQLQNKDASDFQELIGEDTY